MLRKIDLEELLKDGILIDGTDEDLVTVGSLYKVSDGCQ
jgi:hypothetical protein